MLTYLFLHYDLNSIKSSYSITQFLGLLIFHIVECLILGCRPIAIDQPGKVVEHQGLVKITEGFSNLILEMTVSLPGIHPGLA